MSGAACPRCRSDVEEWAGFCPQCGAPLSPTDVPDAGELVMTAPAGPGGAWDSEPGNVLQVAIDGGAGLGAPPFPSSPTGKCPFCLAPVGDAATESCPVCATLHHVDCWKDARGCAVVGCGGAFAAASSPPLDMALPASAGPSIPFAPFGTAPSSPPPSRRSKRPLVLAVIGVAVVAVAAAAAMASGSAESHTVTGSIELHSSSSSYLSEGESCSGVGGYSDMNEGAQVTLRNGKDESLAIGQLGSGVYDSTSRACVFKYTLTNVPKEDFYRVQVSHRGELEYSYDDMQANGWDIQSTLGL